MLPDNLEKFANELIGVLNRIGELTPYAVADMDRPIVIRLTRDDDQIVYVTISDGPRDLAVEIDGYYVQVSGSPPKE